jgi:hypothetical protein
MDNKYPIPDTEYNRRKQDEAKQAQVNDIAKKVNKVEAKMKATSISAPITTMMDLLEEVISACGGESKLTFLDVGSDFIRVATRVPVTANLFQFLEEAPDNPRWHKVVTKILLLCPRILSVRWIPSEDRGAYLIVSLRRE